MKLENFTKTFPRDEALSSTRESCTESCKFVAAAIRHVPELEPFLAQFEGASFGNGLYRVHAMSEIKARTRLCIRYWPELDGHIVCFGSDWMGRQFAINCTRESESYLLLPGEGDFLRIPQGLALLHDQEMISHPDDALDRSAYLRWLDAGGAVPGPDECVGYRQPRFLGGDESIDNLEIQGFTLYWELNAQLYQAVKDLPDGTPIGSIELSDRASPGG